MNNKNGKSTYHECSLVGRQSLFMIGTFIIKKSQ